MAVKNAELIRAALGGKTIQIRWPGSDWTDYDAETVIGWLVHPAPGCEFRIKPDPIKYWVLCFLGASPAIVNDESEVHCAFSNNIAIYRPVSITLLGFDQDRRMVKATDVTAQYIKKEK